MRGVVYVDLLFLETFAWNLCTLRLTDQMAWNVAGKVRLCVGAVVGTGLMTWILLWPLQGVIKLALLAGAFLIMLLVTFSKGETKGFLMLLEAYLGCTLIWGGAMALVSRGFCRLTHGRMQVAIILVTELGSMPFAIRLLCRRNRKERREGRAVLINGDRAVCVRAILDTGNSLYEPISGQPVCVVDAMTARELWKEDDPCRVVPWHGVGVGRGLLKAYKIREMKLSLGGPVKTIRGAYVAADVVERAEAENERCDVRQSNQKEVMGHLIIQPRILEENWQKKEKQKKGGRK